MSDLTAQFLDWVGARPRSRADVIEAWSSTCPRLTVWEDATADGLVRYERGIVTLTDAGRDRRSAAAQPATRELAETRTPTQ